MTQTQAGGCTATPTLRREAEQFFAEMRDRSTDRTDPCLEPLGTGDDGIRRGLELLERRVRHSVRNLQRQLPFHGRADYADVNRRSVERHLSISLITSEAALRENRLLSSAYPSLRTAPVFAPMIIADGQCLVVAGADDLHGQPTAWTTTDRALVARGRHLWDRTRAVSRPALAPGESPPLSRRQLDVAQLMVDGCSDRVIARRIGISERTVASDVRGIVEFVGAVNRVSAVARISGAPARPHAH